MRRRIAPPSVWLTVGGICQQLVNSGHSFEGARARSPVGRVVLRTSVLIRHVTKPEAVWIVFPTVALKPAATGLARWKENVAGTGRCHRWMITTTMRGTSPSPAATSTSPAIAMSGTFAVSVSEHISPASHGRLSGLRNTRLRWFGLSQAELPVVIGQSGLFQNLRPRRQT